MHDENASAERTVTDEMLEAGIDAYVGATRKWPAWKATSHFPVGSSIVVSECLEAAYLAMEAARAKAPERTNDS